MKADIRKQLVKLLQDSDDKEHALFMALKINDYYPRVFVPSYQPAKLLHGFYETDTFVYYEVAAEFIERRNRGEL